MFAKVSLLISLVQLFFLASAAEKIVQSTDGAKIWVNAFGDPKNQPLVLIHGIGGSAMGWDDLVTEKKLLSKFYMITYDMRGHGRSDKPTTAAGYTSKLFADDFVAISSAYKVKSPIVLGWSYGGTVFTDIFTNLPNNTISALIGVAALPYTGLPNVNTPAALTYVPGLFVADNVETNVNSKMAVVDNSYNDASTVPYETKMQRLGAAVTQFPPVSRLLLSRPQDPSALFAAGRQGFPLLMIYGTNDKILQNDVIVNATAPNFTKIQVKRVVGGSHAVFYENKDEFLSAVLDFYKGLRRK